MATDHNFKVKKGLEVLGGDATVSSGNITAGNSSTNKFVRAHYNDGSYMTLEGYGLVMNRGASYIRPSTDGNKTLYIGISLTLVLACSKSNELDSDDLIIEEEFEQLYSCVSYSDVLDPKTTNQDD